MKTIVFAASKGGTGKSSLAFNLGVEASKHGSAYWADMDPQKSLTAMVEARERHHKDLLSPVLLTDVQSVPATVSYLNSGSYARDFLVVDTPGSFMEIIKNSIRAADVVILPVQPSPLDILAQEDVARVIDELGKAAQTLFVMNRVDGRASYDDAMERISALFPNKPLKVHQRQAYMRGAIGGYVGAEMDQKCAQEMADLWTAVDQIMRKTNGKAEHEGNHARIPA